MTLEAWSVPQMSGPITQTSPTLGRGVGRTKYATPIPNPAQEKANQEHTEQPPTRKLGKRQEVEDNPKYPGNGKQKISSAAEKRKSAMDGGASRFIYVTLNPPC